MRNISRIPEISNQIGQNFAQYVTHLTHLLLWDDTKFAAFPNIKPDEIISIRNELTNDGLIYFKHVKPIFQETLSGAISFFDSWFNHYNDIAKF